MILTTTIVAERTPTTNNQGRNGRLVLLGLFLLDSSTFGQDTDTTARVLLFCFLLFLLHGEARIVPEERNGGVSDDEDAVVDRVGLLWVRGVASDHALLLLLLLPCLATALQEKQKQQQQQQPPYCQHYQRQREPVSCSKSSSFSSRR